jgi:dienelactone hydrolase
MSMIRIVSAVSTINAISIKQKISLFFLMVFLMGASTALAVNPPGQPSQGPGGADYTSGRVIKTMHGADDLTYYLFEPDAPKPDTAPVIVFLHGWGGINPDYYATWIEHLVRKGNIVIYPVYQSWSSLLTSNRFTSNCLQAITDAIKLLQDRCQAKEQAKDQGMEQAKDQGMEQAKDQGMERGKEQGTDQDQGQDQQSSHYTKPDLDKFAIAGHSVGGVLALNVASLARQSGLPVPKAIMSVEPRRIPMLALEDFSKIPSRALLLVVAGDRDGLSANDAVMLFRSITQIPFQNKDFVTLVSDDYGTPSLIADHLAPVCNAVGTGMFLTGDTNALDYYGTWKLLDALTDAAFYGKNREYALGNTQQQRYMGKWSDGKSVKELIITTHPVQRSRKWPRFLTPRSKFQEQQSTESEHQGGS